MSQSDYRDSLAYIGTSELREKEVGFLEKGDTVEVNYYGEVAGSYPLQINKINSIKRIKEGSSQNLTIENTTKIKAVNIQKKDGAISRLENKERINSLFNILSSAVKQENITNIRDDRYKISLEYNNRDKKEIIVWVEAIGIASIIDAEDSHSLYSLTFNESKRLREFLK